MSVLYASTFRVSESFTSQYDRPQTRYTLDELVHDIKTYLGDKNGICSSEVDSDYLISLAQKYESSDADWTRYYHRDPTRNYTRNAIENINCKANIVCTHKF